MAGSKGSFVGGIFHFTTNGSLLYEAAIMLIWVRCEEWTELRKVRRAFILLEVKLTALMAVSLLYGIL